MTWQVLLAAALGALLGYGGGWLSPRWLKVRPQAWTLGALAAVNGVLTGLLAAQHPLGSAYFWHHLLFIAILTTAAYVDLHERIIPNELVLFGLGAGLLLLLVAGYPEKSFLQALGGAAAGFGFMYLLAVLVPNGMGYGDVKLMAVIGLFLGWPWIGMGLPLAFLAGGVASAVVIFMRLFKQQNRHIPFGPYLAIGAIATVLYGWEIWVWYTSYALY